MQPITAFIFSLALGAGAPCAAQQPDAASPGTQAAELSARVQDDVTSLLAQLVGEGRARAFVAVEGELALKSKTDSESPEDERLSLPGYSTLNILEKTGQYLKQQNQQTQRTTEFRVKKMSVSLVFDRSIPEARVNAIKIIVSDLLRLAEARGDSITATRTEMLPWWKSALSSAGDRRILLAAAAAAFILFALLVLGYLLAARLLAQLSDRARASAPGTPGGSAPRTAEGTISDEDGNVVDIEAAPGPSGALLTTGSGFDFLEQLPAAAAAELLAETPEEDAAIVIANLSDRKPHVSSKILLALTPAKRQAVTAGMLELRQAEPERVFEIENELRLKMEKTLKGAEKLGHLLSLVGEAQRTEIMDGLTRTNPKASAELRRNMVTFDSLCGLDEKNLRPLVLAIPYADWAAALWGVPEAAAGSIIRLLPEDVRLIVKEMLSTRPEDDKLLGARARIISSALDLGGKGRIELASLKEAP